MVQGPNGTTLRPVALPRVPVVEDKTLTGLDPHTQLVVRRSKSATVPKLAPNLLDEPLHFGDDCPFLWDCDMDVPRRHLGLTATESEQWPSEPFRGDAQQLDAVLPGDLSLAPAAVRLRHGPNQRPYRAPDR